MRSNQTCITTRGAANFETGHSYHKKCFFHAHSHWCHIARYSASTALQNAPTSSYQLHGRLMSHMSTVSFYSKASINFKVLSRCRTWYLVAMGTLGPVTWEMIKNKISFFLFFELQSWRLKLLWNKLPYRSWSIFYLKANHFVWHIPARADWKRVSNNENICSMDMAISPFSDAAENFVRRGKKMYHMKIHLKTFW